MSTPRISGVYRRVAAAGFAILAVFSLGSCSDSTAAADTQAPNLAQAELPELPAVGGAQDVWGFAFGMDADREAVKASLGDPSSRTDTDDAAGGARITRWVYPELEVTFLIDESEEHDYLLSILIKGSDVPLRGGLSIGMPLAKAVALLGEPRVTNDTSRVYFYRNTTIELLTDGTTVNAVQLARALP